MFERFTEATRAALVEAQNVALELGARWIAPAHLLCGCAEVQGETAGNLLRDVGLEAAAIRRLLPRAEEQLAARIDPEALRAVGIDYDGVRAAVELTFGSGALDAAPDRRVVRHARRRPSYTPGAKQSLELAWRAASELHHDQITPGHLLLGLLRLDDETVTGLIAGMGLTVTQLSSDVLARLSSAA